MIKDALRLPNENIRRVLKERSVSFCFQWCESKNITHIVICRFYIFVISLDDVPCPTRDQGSDIKPPLYGLKRGETELS